MVERFLKKATYLVGSSWVEYFILRFTEFFWFFALLHSALRVCFLHRWRKNAAADDDDDDDDDDHVNHDVYDSDDDG